jgi:hypothetical protein
LSVVFWGGGETLFVVGSSPFLIEKPKYPTQSTNAGCDIHTILLLLLLFMTETNMRLIMGM